jgi:hypothetical protein
VCVCVCVCVSEREILCTQTHSYKNIFEFRCTVGREIKGSVGVHCVLRRNISSIILFSTFY